MTFSSPRSTWIHSYTSREIWDLGHHAPPFFSVRILPTTDMIHQQITRSVHQHPRHCSHTRNDMIRSTRKWKQDTLPWWRTRHAALLAISRYTYESVSTCIGTGLLTLTFVILTLNAITSYKCHEEPFKFSSQVTSPNGTDGRTVCNAMRTMDRAA